jgi:ATP-dependent protease ClpP protease subunit
MYCIDPSAEIPIMMLDKHIGYDSEDGIGIDGSAFAAELMYLDTLNKKSIDVWICCPGGSVIDGMKIYNAILNSKTPVDTYNTGIAASMGGVCFMAGRKRRMADYSKLMLHNPSGSDDKKAMESLRDSIATMLSAKSSLTSDAVGYLMEKTSWIKSSECFEKGFCTEVVASSEQNRKRMAAVNDAKMMWIVATDIVNNVFKNTNDMKKITAKLNLNAEASEDAILAAIDAIENKLTEVTNTATADKTKLEGDLKAAKDNLAASEKKVTEAEAKLKEITDKAATDAAAIADKAALEMVTVFAKVGRIKNDAATIETWKKLAVNDFDGTKKIIEELPLNKVSAKIDITETNPDAVKASATAQGVMYAIENKLKNKTA